jgi:heterodisulfide reductase subunit C/nitrate reductase gamma subunit
MHQILFILALLATIGVFMYTLRNLIANFKLLKPAFAVKQINERINITLKVAFGQTKIMRRPVIGFLHALVWWGFLIILFGSIEMVIDGIFGQERILSVFGIVYDILIATGDVFGAIIALAILVFLFRRLFMNIKRFQGVEMSHKSHMDANIALSIILILMLSLLGMNLFYQVACIQREIPIEGIYPISGLFVDGLVNISSHSTHIGHEINWWVHILGIFIFANILPYSKHFHVFMSVPNVFFSRLQPLTQMNNMESITKEVKLMMDPDAAFADPAEGEEEEVSRFGMKDVEDGTWKNYMDSLACTQCGRCTSVCPANITGKLLSPRKIMIDYRARMKEKGKELVKDASFDDNKSFIRDYISEEELWACTTCNACAQECPININQPEMILEMRRFLVMEEAGGPSELNTVFTNIENNGAPWQFSPEDRMLWADNITINMPEEA